MIMAEQINTAEQEQNKIEIAQAVNESRLSTVFNIYKEHFELSDPQGFTIIIATAIAHFIPGEMLW